MCTDCGCQEANHKTHSHHHYVHQPNHLRGFTHKTHTISDDAEVAHLSGNTKEIRILNLETNILQKNNEIAHRNFHWFEDHDVKAINLMSSPGSGKTTLLEKTLDYLRGHQSICVLVGDQKTDRDANRLSNKGAKIKQINTHSSCHLDASHIASELGGFVSGEEDLLIIENIGNLVCPAAFDLGESKKIAILSVAEGEDKPIKYPVLFHIADVILLTKIDLIPYVDWDDELALKFIRQVNPLAKVISLSARTGDGMDDWYQYLSQI